MDPEEGEREAKRGPTAAMDRQAEGRALYAGRAV